MKRITSLLAVLVALTGVISGQALAAETSPLATERLQGLEQGILTGLNDVRALHGLGPLTLSSDLQDAAVAHSQSMLDNGFFEHDSRDGSPFYVRLKEHYTATGYDSWSVGENLLYNTGELDAATAIEAWLASPAHRENMLAPSWREVGIGALHATSAGGTFGGSPTWVVTMDFGTRTGNRAAAPAPTPGSPPLPRRLAHARPTTAKASTKLPARAHKRTSRPRTQQVRRVLPTPIGFARDAAA